MLGSIYKGTAGMIAYSKGLSNISSNVANMNTPGYKRTELHFQSLVYGKELGSSSGQEGYQNNGAAGVDATLKSTVYSQGELRKSENDADMAIDGNGFFILRDGNKNYYSRVGQFEFNQDGVLVDKTYGFEVAALNGNKALGSIDLHSFRAINPVATSLLTFVGNLSVGSTTHTVDDVEVYDTTGSKHTLTIKFTNNAAVTSRSWLVNIENSDGDVLASNLEFRFNDNGSPAEGFNEAVFSLTSDTGVVSDVKFSIGEPGSFNQVTSSTGSAASSVRLEKADGYGPGMMTSFSITDAGEIEVKYSNEQTLVADQIALARFESPDDLIDQGKGLLSAQSFQKAIVGASNSLGIGSIVGRSIELSNVDLTSQFTDMIVLQRGYQASSQVLTSSNEMLQQLIDATRSR